MNKINSYGYDVFVGRELPDYFRLEGYIGDMEEW